jgi:predicted permease
VVDDRLRPALDREVEEEIAFHLEMRVRELVAAGMDPEEARAEATRRMGDVDRVKARMRREGARRDGRMSRRQWWDHTARDLNFALRQLRRAPSFAVVAILTLALAIGSNTAVFSVVDGVLLRPLPYERPDELAMLWTRYLPPSGFDIPKFAISGPEFLDYQESTRAFRSVGAYQTGTRALTGDGAEAERISVAFVSDDVLPLLGVRPAIGRWIDAGEDVPDGPAVAVLGHDLWMTRYGSDSTLLGRTILMNGVATEVVGVMPREFEFPSGTQAWLPMGLDRTSQGNRGGHGIFGVGRLAPGRTLADAEAELDVVKERWAAEYEHNVGHFVWTEGMKEAVVGDAPRTLWLLATAVGLVLLVACSNVANLLLARGERRQTEVSIRAALGADRGRIARQLVTESLVLAGLAGLLGLGLASVATPALIAMAPSALPRLAHVGLDARVVAFSLGAAAVTALLFGVAPVLLAGRRGLARAASSSTRAVGGRRSGGLRRTLVTAEVALSLVVVVLAGLLVRSYAALRGSERGLDTANLLTFGVTLPPSDYPRPELVPLDYVRLLDGIRALPGVAAASAGTTLPFSGGMSQWDFQLDDRPPRQEGERAWNAGIAFVQPGFFETLGIPIVSGRPLASADDAGAPLVAVVSEAFEDVYWPGESAVGQRFGYGPSQDSVPWITVVGVAPDQRRQGLDDDPYPFVWIPQLQALASTASTPRSLRIAVRTGTDPEALTPAVREAVYAFDADLPLHAVATMEDAVSDTLARPRLATNLLGTFALIALVLAAVGIYGVIAYSVAGRTREIGVRMALGAGRGEVVRMILDEGARPVIAGVVVGVAGAWFATELVGALLYGVAPRDPLTFTVLPLVLLAIGVAASALPAWRATQITPTEALRED